MCHISSETPRSLETSRYRVVQKQYCRLNAASARDGVAHAQRAAPVRCVTQKQHVLWGAFTGVCDAGESRRPPRRTATRSRAPRPDRPARRTRRSHLCPSLNRDRGFHTKLSQTLISRERERERERERRRARAKLLSQHSAVGCWGEDHARRV